LSSANQATPFWAWLVGRHPKKRTLAIAGVGGLLLGIVTVSTNGVVWWANVILFALVFDLAAGFVSNLSHSTRFFGLVNPFFLEQPMLLPT
jgi:hypothetical protein